MSTQEDIRTYYDSLAERYDENRFGNSYGQYIHQQEKAILSQWLEGIQSEDILELGCGTGRLLDFAQTGIDFSASMLQVAAKKYPNHRLIPGDITQLPFYTPQFQAVFSTHVFMHLDIGSIRKTIQEVHRVLRPGGLFIFDVPNLWRRKVIRYQKSGWHGNTALNEQEIQVICGADWELTHREGILLFPIHHLPPLLRAPFRPLDSLLCRTSLKKYASYHFYVLKKH